MSNVKIIYSLKIYLSLNELGFTPVATMPNPNNNKLICWVYEKTPEFIEAFEKLLEEARK